MTLRHQGSIEVARIAGVFGVHGELKCDPTSAGRTVVAPGAQLRCERAGESTSVRLASVRAHKDRLLVRFDGVDDADAAAAYVGGVLFAARDAIELDEGEYLDEDLVGCRVEDGEGRCFGEVDRVEHYPSSDMLVVSGRMVPMVRAIVTKIDLAARRIVVDPPEGLLERP
jgi:16S rRNA processing protein RimM